MKKRLLAVLLAGAMVLSITACGSSKDSSKSTTEAAKKEETTTITLAAAASLEKCYTEKLIPMFEKENKGIKVEGSYDSSGKLQSQIENGMAADVFMSAATQQMNNLVKEKYISKGDVVELLENKCGWRMLPTAIRQACQYISISRSCPSHTGAGRILRACSKGSGSIRSGRAVRYSFSATKTSFT